MLTGSCLCGRVRYRVTGKLGPVGLCPCADCRKANGSAFASNAPVQARYLAFFMVVTTLWSGISGAQGGVAHFAHLGGLVFGYVYLRLRDRKAGAGKVAWQKKMAPPSAKVSDREAMRRWASIQPDTLHELNRTEVEQLLAKVTQQGAGSLSTDERAFLDRMATH